jgi:hypothetical protein
VESNFDELIVLIEPGLPVGGKKIQLNFNFLGRLIYLIEEIIT